MPAAGPALRVELLGPLRVQVGDRAVEVRGGRLRTLLVRLALGAGRPVPATALVDALWPEDPPADTVNALQSLVSRLRAALGDASLVRQVDGGYLLEVAADDVDAVRFARLGRQPGQAAQALALWRGDLPSEVPGARLEQLRLEVLCSRIDGDLAGGGDVLDELQELTRLHPASEELAGRLMVALSRQGRQAEGLQEFERIRQRLADELGADPSSGLQARHLEVLRVAPEPVRSNLRAPLTSFVGRGPELADIAQRLGSFRLVTVVGPGGAGKTRLATEAAARARTAGGTWLVELAPVSEPDDVPLAALTAIGLRESALLDHRAAPREAVARLVEALGGTRALLVLDNAEHLLDAVAELCDSLLARCPDLRVLVTSREALGMAGECLVPLAPLEVPAPGSTGAQALRHPSVALFADRAAAVLPGFAVDPETVDDVVELVRRLDGLPLALELAAARLRSLPLAEVVRRLDDRFRLLTGGSRTALPRHRTLRAVVAWSWELLDDDERRLADRASVFPGGLTVDSARAVVLTGDVPDLLAALVDKSLLQLVPGPRYRMLESLREYGAERLAEAGELADVRSASARYFADLVAHADRELRGPQQLRFLGRLRDERDNVLAALRCLTDLGRTDAALALCLDLGWYWLLLGRHAEATAHLAAALAFPAGRDDVQRLSAEVLLVLNEQAEAPLDAGLERRVTGLATRLPPPDVAAWPLLTLLAPIALFLAGDTAGSKQLLDRAVEDGDTWLGAAARVFRARFQENAGDLEAVRRDLAPAMVTFRELGDRWGLVSALPLAAQLRQYDGDLEGAVELLEEADRLSGELGAHDLDDRLFISIRLADLHLRLGRRDRADAVMDEVGRLAGGATNGGWVAVHEGLQGTYLRERGDLAGARRLLAAAESHLALRPDASPHGTALVLSAGAWLDLADGDVVGARTRLSAAYGAARASRDAPIAALVGLAGAQLALDLGEPAEAAELLGAAARLRGAEDPTAHDVRLVRACAVERLGEAGFGTAYARGWALDVAGALDRVDPGRLPQARRL